jgi:hypothetical protein
LAKGVIQVGYSDDLTYYYLGRAAEGLGHLDAARTYYKLSNASRTKCASIINNCDGIKLPLQSQERLSNLETGSKAKEIETKIIATQKKDEKPKKIRNRNVNRSTLIQAMKDTLLDPYSAKFGKHTVVGDYACLTINAKNAFGAYTGKKQYLLSWYGEQHGWQSFTSINASHQFCVDMITKLAAKGTRSKTKTN